MFPVDWKRVATDGEETPWTSYITTKGSQQELGEGKEGTTQSNGEAILSAAVGDVWRPSAAALTWLLVSFYTASPSTGLCSLSGEGKEQSAYAHEFCKGRYSCNGPAPGNTLSCPVSQAPCTCSARASTVWSSSWWSACLLQCLFLNSWRSWRISSQMRKGQRWPMPWKVSQHPSPKNAVSFGLKALQPSCPALFPGLPFYYKDNDIKHADTKHVDSFSTKPGPLLITSGWFSSWWEGLCTQICLPSGQIHWVCIPRTSLEAVSVAWVS